MSKLILSLDGGGIRGLISAVFLNFLDKRLVANGTSLRDQIDLIAGTSTGGIIALAITCTDISISKIAELYDSEKARRIFTENFGLFEADGVNAPKYEGGRKTEVLRETFRSSLLGHANIPVMVPTYDLIERRPFILKSCRHITTRAYLAADATSAAPTYFPSVQIGDKWLIDGGVVANNPTMCAVAEARRMWPGERLKVLSVGTGSQVRPVDWYDSQDWGAVQWMIKGDLLGIVMDEGIVEYQAETMLGDDYLRVNCRLNKNECIGLPPNDDMDDLSIENIELLKRLGGIWDDRFGEKAVNLIRS